MLHAEKLDKLIEESEEIVARMKSATFSAEDYKKNLESLALIRSEIWNSAKSIKDLVISVQTFVAALEDKLWDDKMKQLEKVSVSIEELKHKLKNWSDDIAVKNVDAIKPILNTYASQIVKKTLSETNNLKILIYISLAISGLLFVISLISLIK